MKLIKKLGTRISKSDRLVSYGIYICPFPECLAEVERPLGNGERKKSCGCRRKKGDSYTRLYKIWTGVKNRCFNSNNQAYSNYGGRGITVCPEWTDKENGYISFRDWSLNNGYQENLVIDRINNNGNYEPSNCRWLTVLESLRNKTNTINMEIANEIRTL